MDSDIDFTDDYNTHLNDKDRKDFTAWIQKQSQATGRDVSKDLYDYDLAGWWQKNQKQDLTGAHLTDEYKKPNHPTFSDQSIYNGAEGNVGGKWNKLPTGQYSFTPGYSNAYDSTDLKDYFSKVETNNYLLNSDGSVNYQPQ